MSTIKQLETKRVEVKKSNYMFNSVRFLSSVILKENDANAYHYKTHIKVDESGMAFATNGHVLNFCSLPFGSGFYKVIKNTKAKVVLERVYDASELSYPDCTDLMVAPDVDGFDCEFTSGNASSIYTKIVRAMTVTTLEFNYIQSLCETVDQIMTVIIPEPTSRYANSEDGEEKQTCQPIHCVNSEFHSVIMPKTV